MHKEKDLTLNIMQVLPALFKTRPGFVLFPAIDRARLRTRNAG